jgi:hypothetical protein
MPAPVGRPDGRYHFETHDHEGQLLAYLPYRNAQGEFMLGLNGAQMRVDVPYRGYGYLSYDTLYPGKHELWIYDTKLQMYIFQGPIWSATPSSSTGAISVSAQDALSYLAKRLIITYKQYESPDKPEDVLAALLADVNGYWLINSMNSSSIMRNGSKAIDLIVYKSYELNKVSDLFTSVSAMGDGVEFYVRNGTLWLYGGGIQGDKKPLSMEYGGNMDGHSVEFNAQTIANADRFVGDNGRVGYAGNDDKKTEYDMLYQDVTTGSDLTSTTDLANAAATDLKNKQDTLIVPTMVTRKLTPMKDFDFGTNFLVYVNDWYVQLSKVIRTIGWQLTITGGDKTTTVIYSKDSDTVET